MFDGEIANPKVPKITGMWSGTPVGGSVVFVVTLFSAEGWNVGQGTSESVTNEINDTDLGALTVTVSVKQVLYKLDSDTRYAHSNFLVYENRGYAWKQTTTPPTETREALGSGEDNPSLDTLDAMAMDALDGVLGYAWTASQLGAPPINGGGDSGLELSTLQNLAYRGDDPGQGLMTAPFSYRSARCARVSDEPQGHDRRSSGRLSFWTRAEMPKAVGTCAASRRSSTPTCRPTIHPASSNRKPGKAGAALRSCHST